MYIRNSLLFFLGLCLSACSEERPQVVVYTSVDQIFSQPLLQQFENETGIQVKAVYDTEATKTVGLAKRLLFEKQRPRADVFWNSEYLRTLMLAKQGVLASLPAELSRRVPEEFRGPNGDWLGFGLRARVFVVNTDLVAANTEPHSLWELTTPRWRGKVVIAQPFFGTTATHFSALYLHWGEEKFNAFLLALQDNDVAVLPGNSDVRDAVVRGDYSVGLTDTDDVNVALRRGEPVQMIFPDQDQRGAFSVYQTVAQIRNAPHPKAAQQLIRFLSEPGTEQLLIRAGAVQLSARGGVEHNSQQGRPKLWSDASEKMLHAQEQSAMLVRAVMD